MSSSYRVAIVIVVVAMVLQVTVAAFERRSATPEWAAVDSTRCASIATELAAAVQAYVDQFAGLAAADLFTTPAPTAVADPGTLASQSRVLAERLGCPVDELQADVRSAITEVRGDGPIAEAIAASIRADVFRGAVPEDAQPRDRVTVEQGDDVAATAASLPAGSRLVLGVGEHRIDDPLVLFRPIEIVGSGRDATTLVSSAATAVVLYLGGGRLVVRDVTLEHDGDVAASVLVVTAGSFELADSRIEGARQNSGQEGGAGLLVAIPSTATPASGAGEPTIEDDDLNVVLGTEFRDNDAAGLLLASGSVDVRGSVVRDTRGCGVCVFDDSSLDEMEVSGNGIGVLARQEATPTISRSRIIGNEQGGVVFAEASRGVLVDSVVSGNGALGVGIGDDAAPSLEGNEITHDTGPAVTISGTASPSLTRTVIDANQIGVQVLDAASPTVVDLLVIGLGAVAVLVGDGGVLSVTDLVVDGSFQIGVQAQDDSTVTVERARVSGTAVAAMILTGSAAADASDLTCQDTTNGIVLLEGSLLSTPDPGCAVLDQR